MTDKQLAEIFKRTQGHCHYCGDRVILGHYAKADGIPGAWEADHVI